LENLTYHTILSYYFTGRSLYLDDPGKSKPDIRKLAELPWQEINCEMWDAVSELLCDLFFIEAKCRGGLSYDLMSDFHNLLSTQSSKFYHRKSVNHFFNFYRKKRPVLELNPEIICQEAFNYEKDGPVHQPAAQILVDKKPDKSIWIRRQNLPENTGSLEQVLYGHTKWVDFVEVLNNGQEIVSCCSDTIRVWDLITGRCKRIFNFAAHIFTIMPDEKKLLAASDWEIKIIDIKTGLVIKSWQEDSIKSPCSALKVSTDGKYALIGRDDGNTDIIDLESGEECIWLWDKHEKMVSSISVFKDNSKVITGSSDKTLKIWDTLTGECLDTLTGHEDEISCIVVSDEGNKIVSGSWDHTLKLWDTSSGKCIRTFRGHSNHVCSIVITQDGKHAISGSADNDIRIWDLEKGDCLRILKGHTASVSTIALLPDESELISGSYDHSLRTWSLNSSYSLNHITDSEPVSFITSNPENDRIVGINDEGTVRVWDALSGICIENYKVTIIKACGICVTSDKELIIISNENKTVLWNMQKAVIVKEFNYEGNPVTKINSFAITQDEDEILTGSWAGGAWIFGIGWGYSIINLSGDIIYDIAVTDDGNNGLTVGENGFVGLWELKSRNFKLLTGHNGDVTVVKTVPGSLLAVTGSMDGSAKIWNLTNQLCLHTLSGHSDAVRTLAVSPNGKSVITGSDDQKIKMWDVETGCCIRTFSGHKSGIWKVAFLSDGRHIISGGYHDCCAKIWNIDTGSLIGEYYTEGKILNIICSEHYAHFTILDGSGEIHFLSVENL
jgi:WD40 repeat protein